jgi:hypothetical protein
VVDSSGEVDLGWLEWVVCGEVDGQEEDAALERAVTLRGVSQIAIIRHEVSTYGTHDGCLPVELSILSVYAPDVSRPPSRSGRTWWGSAGVVTYKIVSHGTGGT